MEGCRRECYPVPTMFCKGKGLLRMPRIAFEESSTKDSGKPILRLHMPYNRIVLENDTFADVILEKV